MTALERTLRKYCFAYDHAYSVESADHWDTQRAIFLSIAKGRISTELVQKGRIFF